MKIALIPSLIARIAKLAVTGLMFMSVVMVLTALAADPAIDTAKPNDTTKPVTADTTRDTLPKPDEYVPVDTLPEMIQEQPPVYPREAKIKEQKGTVWVKALVGTNGKVYSVRLAKTSGTQILDESAMTAAYKCIYRPAKKDGRPVACWVTYKVEFKFTVR